MLNSLFLSIGFFTILPIKGKWNEKDFSRFTFFLPLIGALTGAIASLVLLIDGLIYVKAVLLAISFIVINGGLHFDGMVDCGDAYFSQKDHKRKSEIMSDPRVGAFGALTALIYFALLIAISFEVLPKATQLIVFLIPIISRTALSIFVSIGRKSEWPGLLPDFSKTQKIWTVISATIVLSIVSIFAWKFVLVGIVWLFIFELFCKKKFGGISGDACGAFVTILDLLLLGGIIWLL